MSDRRTCIGCGRYRAVRFFVRAERECKDCHFTGAVCPFCRKVKPLTDFLKNPTTKRRRGVCKVCRGARVGLAGAKRMWLAIELPTPYREGVK